MFMFRGYHEISNHLRSMMLKVKTTNASEIWMKEQIYPLLPVDPLICLLLGGTCGFFCVEQTRLTPRISGKLSLETKCSAFLLRRIPLRREWSCYYVDLHFEFTLLA